MLVAGASEKGTPGRKKLYKFLFFHLNTLSHVYDLVSDKG